MWQIVVNEWETVRYNKKKKKVLEERVYKEKNKN